jgi:hypothetical protein
MVVDVRTLLEPLLAAAEHQSLALGHNYVGSEHLLLAIIQRACPRLRDVLNRHGLTPERAKEAIRHVLQG